MNIYYSLFNGKTINGCVFRIIVPHVNPKPNDEHNKVSGREDNSSAISETINIKIDAPPRLPNFRRLYGTFFVGSFNFLTRRSTINLFA